MGICKCRKRTDLFCWHCHRAVCLDCITDEEHNLAYVGTYIKWLDSPESPPLVCPLSKAIITATDEVIRFMNLDIFLLSSIDEYGKNKPPNTALAGFTIPGTNDPMVPPPEDKSKLAQQIRQKLNKFPWISTMIALQTELVPQTQPQVHTLQTQPQSKHQAHFSDPLAKPEGYGLDLNTKEKTAEKSNPTDVDLNYTTDPLSSSAGITPRKPTTLSTNTGTPKKSSRPTQPLDQPVDLDLDPHLAKGAPYTPARFREEDPESDKYKRRPIEMEALGFSAPTRTGREAPRYQITGNRLLLMLALVVTLLVVFCLSISLDEDTTVPLYQGLEELSQNATTQQIAPST